MAAYSLLNKIHDGQPETPAPPHIQYASDAHGDHAFTYRSFTSDAQNKMTRLQSSGTPPYSLKETQSHAQLANYSNGEIKNPSPVVPITTFSILDCYSLNTKCPELHFSLSIKKPPNWTVEVLVAGTGFEPMTFGL